MNTNMVGWFEIYVQDMPRAVAFYQAVLGQELEKLPMDEPMMMAFPSNMEAYGASGALVKMDCAPSGEGGTLVYFSCDDCALEESRVEAAGGKVERSKMSIGEYGFVSMIRDTEGNMIGLHSMQ